ncbi:hypothetical protein BDC45DRAFT_567807 [Circinella umbellata]|nr:hypothetical protein BDC45DRAFT_567806 [Circinella umbellata]KAI7855840.1 hypothetical protein BDC45DRAFT_567807 [Circinella umbellata]
MDTKAGKHCEDDHANCEVAKRETPVSKSDTNKIKLLVESKLILDQLLATTKYDEPVAIPALQLCGNSVFLYSLCLAADGLYVGAQEAQGMFPQNAFELMNLRNVVNLLYNFWFATKKIANIKQSFTITSVMTPQPKT